MIHFRRTVTLTIVPVVGPELSGGLEDGVDEDDCINETVEVVLMLAGVAVEVLNIVSGGFVAAGGVGLTI